MPTQWDPWKERLEIPKLKRSEPPCKDCRYWSPEPIYRDSPVGQQYDGARCCWAPEMHRDFSCFCIRLGGRDGEDRT